MTVRVPHTDPENEPELTVEEAAGDLFSAEAVSRRGARFRRDLLRNTPETFLVSGAAMSGGAITWRWYGAPDSATFWRDEMASVEGAAASQYPIFHHATWGNDAYNPVLGGPGLHVDSVYGQSLWDDVLAAAPAGSAIRMGPAQVVGNVPETIDVEAGGFPGSHVFLAERTAPDGNSMVIKTAESAVANDIDATAAALQTFIEDALATLQADHPENFDESFGFTQVPIVEG